MSTLRYLPLWLALAGCDPRDDDAEKLDPTAARGPGLAPADASADVPDMTPQDVVAIAARASRYGAEDALAPEAGTSVGSPH